MPPRRIRTLSGGDLVVTYATNSFRFEEQVGDGGLYYPRFVRLTRCRSRSTQEPPISWLRYKAMLTLR